MVNEGMVFDNRYEITGKIGAGGMSDVYKAKDHKLNRYVAVKILKNEYSEDRNFVSKFHVEAQSAAILMHPNIVNVYDVGEENGMHYIVMELVEGVTLKKYIEKKLRLSFKETMSIAIQVSMGIESAHNKHIIHRDIKPQNIIISRDGKVKVTDFGIARAATKNTVTSNVMGSVHYTSPEQARGSYSDAKSDIYSLGITMFEMLTGRVPFDGENMVSIAVKHVQEALPSPRSYVEDIPISAVQIIYKCCEKNPAKRYQSMAELITDLKKALMSPDEEFVQFVDIETKGKTQMVTESEMQNIRSKTEPIILPEDDFISPGRPVKNPGTRRPYPSDSYRPDNQIYDFGSDRSFSEGYDEPEHGNNGYDEVGYDHNGYDDTEYDNNYSEYNDNYEEYAGGYDDGSYQETAYENDPYDEGYDDYGYEKPAKTVRPGLNNRSQRQSLAGKKKTSAQKHDKPAKNKKDDRRPPVKKTKPKPKPAKRDNGYDDDGDDNIDPKMERIMSALSIIAALIIAIIAIFLVSRMMGIFDTPRRDTAAVSSNAYVTVPAVTGMNIEEAKNLLKKQGLKVTARYESSSKAERDQVIGQSIAEGESVPSDTEIELTVSSGEDGVKIPDVIGKSEAEARVVLEENGFIMESDESSSDTVPKGSVISQNPAAGEEAQKGSVVTVMISTGKSDNTVEVPDIRLKSEDEALALLVEAGLTGIKENEVASAVVPKDCVVSQSYSPGVSVAQGTSITYTLSTGPEGALPGEPENVQNKLYKCNLSVTAPTAYTGGTAVVTLTQSGTGTVLFQSATTSFPVAINLNNITGSDTAVLTVAYQITNTYITENEDGTTNSRTTSEEKTDSKQVTLTPQ